MSDASLYQALEVVIAELSELKSLHGEIEELGDGFKSLSHGFSDLNENQLTLQKAVEKSLLNFQLAEDLSKRSDRNASEAVAKVKELEGEFGLIRKSFTQNSAAFNRLDIETQQLLKDMDYRLKSIEEDSLPRVYDELGAFLTIEAYKDDQQDAEIEEYRTWKAGIKAFVQRWGVPIGMASFWALSRLRNQVNWEELIQWFVDLTMGG